MATPNVALRLKPQPNKSSDERAQHCETQHCMVYALQVRLSRSSQSGRDLRQSLNDFAPLVILRVPLSLLRLGVGTVEAVVNGLPHALQYSFHGVN